MSETHDHGEHQPDHGHAPKPADHGPAATPEVHGHGHDAHGHGHAPAGHAPAAGHGAHAPAGHAAPAAHGAGHPDNLGRNIGMTMAVLGVLLAFSSASVGGERTEFVGTMIQQTAATGQLQSVATKHRVLQAQLQQLHASMPRQPEFDRNKAELVKLEAELVKLEDEQKLGHTLSETVRALRFETNKIVNTVAPTKDDLLRFARLVKKYSHEREACEEWAESFESCVQLHEAAAERYELATLAAEIGIVMASIALLLQNRKTWVIAMIFGAASISVLAITGTRTHLALAATEHKIHEAKAAYAKVSESGDEEIEDEKLLKEVTGQPFDEKAAIAAAAARKRESASHGHGGAEHGTAAHEEPKHGEKHEAPAHGEPKHGEAKHEEPKHEAPKHEEPKHGEGH